MGGQTGTVIWLLAGLFAAGCWGSYEVELSGKSGPSAGGAEQAAQPASHRTPTGPEPGAAGPAGQPAQRWARPAPRPSQAGEADQPELASERLPQAPVGRPAGGSRPAADGQAPAGSPALSSAGQSPWMELSAGVAVPQMLPTGTAMGFSIDYEFVRGEPNSSLPYAWVIEPGKGQPVKQPVRLKRQGTLQGFVLRFRPENGPFRTHIEDAHGKRLSRSVPLQ